MAENPLRIEYEYFPDPTRGRPVSNGEVYAGLEKADPTILANRVDVVLIQQDGTRVAILPAEQPFSTSPGGVIEYQGSPAIIRVDGVVSIAVLDSAGDQVYYNPSANQADGSTGGGGGGSGTTGTPLNGSFEVETVAGQADNWTYAEASNGTIDVDGANQAHGFKSLRFVSGSAAGSGTATSDRFNVLSNGKSDIRFNLKSTSANVLNTVSIRYYGSAGTILTTNTAFSDGATNPINFASYIVNDLAPSGAIEAEIILTGVSSGGATTVGTTWFDDVTLDAATGTFEVGDTGSVIKTTDVGSSANSIGISSAITGQPPTINQVGPDDLGVLIEQVLIKNGIITGDLTGNVTGDVTGNLTGNADTVSVAPIFSGDVNNDDGAGNPTNTLKVTQVPPGTIGSLGIKTDIINVVNNATIPNGSTINITDIGLLYVQVRNNGFDAHVPQAHMLINGLWAIFAEAAIDNSVFGGFVFSNGSNVRVFDSGGANTPVPSYSVDKIED